MVLGWIVISMYSELVKIVKEDRIEKLRKRIHSWKRKHRCIRDPWWLYGVPSQPRICNPPQQLPQSSNGPCNYYPEASYDSPCWIGLGTPIINVIPRKNWATENFSEMSGVRSKNEQALLQGHEESYTWLCKVDLQVKTRVDRRWWV